MSEGRLLNYVSPPPPHFLRVVRFYMVAIFNLYFETYNPENLAPFAFAGRASSAHPWASSCDTGKNIYYSEMNWTLYTVHMQLEKYLKLALVLWSSLTFNQYDVKIHIFPRAKEKKRINHKKSNPCLDRTLIIFWGPNQPLHAKIGWESKWQGSELDQFMQFQWSEFNFHPPPPPPASSMPLLRFCRTLSRSSWVSRILFCSRISFSSYWCFRVWRRRWLFSNSSINFCLISISQVRSARSAWKFAAVSKERKLISPRRVGI